MLFRGEFEDLRVVANGSHELTKIGDGLLEEVRDRELGDEL